MAQHRHEARVGWVRGDETFTDDRYSRRHEWRFDGGALIAASASPSVVPEPMSAPEAVDPEEALVAATSSCHMLWFLSLAARRGFVVDEYRDEALGHMGPNGEGRLAFSRIVLRPEIRFAGPPPGGAELNELHRAAHERCFIASSLRCDVLVEDPASDETTP